MTDYNIVIEIYKDNVWTNINRYISGCSPIPYINRNRDYTPIAEGVNMDVSANCGYEIIRNDLFRVIIDYVCVFNGYVNDVTFDYENRKYVIELNNNPMKLQQYFVESSVLHSVLTNNGGDVFKYTVSNNKPIVNILWLLQCMFSVAGMSLDVSSVQNNKVYSGVFNYYGNVETVDILCKHFCTDEGLLYAINQDVNATQPFTTNKLTLWDVFVEICSIFGFGIVISGTNSYTLIQGGTVSVLDDAKCQYLEKEVLNEYTTAHIENKNGIINPDGSITELTSKTDESKTEAVIKWYNNFVLYNYGYFGGQFSATSGYLQSIYPSVSMVDNPYQFYPARNKVIAQIKPYKNYTITTDINLTQVNILKNYINIKDRTSDIEMIIYI